MKELQTVSFQKRQADLISHPPVPGEEELVEPKKKKKKLIYQLGLWVDDVGNDE